MGDVSYVFETFKFDGVSGNGACRSSHNPKIRLSHDCRLCVTFALIARELEIEFDDSDDDYHDVDEWEDIGLALIHT